MPRKTFFCIIPNIIIMIIIMIISNKIVISYDYDVNNGIIIITYFTIYITAINNVLKIRPIYTSKLGTAYSSVAMIYIIILL